MDEFIRADGLGDPSQVTLCIHCGENEGTFKCQDCFGQGLYYMNCIVASHVYLPLHQLLVSFLLIMYLSVTYSSALNFSTGTTPSSKIQASKNLASK